MSRTPTKVLERAASLEGEAIDLMGTVNYTAVLATKSNLGDAKLLAAPQAVIQTLEQTVAEKR